MSAMVASSIFSPPVVDQLDAVVIIGIVAGGNHYAAVKVLGAGHIGHAGGGGHMGRNTSAPGGGQPAAQGVLQHIAGAAGVLADDHPGPFALPFAIIPSQKTPHFESVFHGEVHIGLTPEAVGSKISAHRSKGLLICFL